jgi:hypothetical protein
MTSIADSQAGSSSPPPDAGLDEIRIAAGLAELAAAADRLRRLPLDDEEPGLTFDPTWPDESPR